MEKIKWDGITEIEKIMPALLGLITDEEQQQAKKMAYGILRRLSVKNIATEAQIQAVCLWTLSGIK